MFKVLRKQAVNPELYSEENCSIQEWSFLYSPGVSHTSLVFSCCHHKTLDMKQGKKLSFWLTVVEYTVFLGGEGMVWLARSTWWCCVCHQEGRQREWNVGVQLVFSVLSSLEWFYP